MYRNITAIEGVRKSRRKYCKQDNFIGSFIGIN